MRFNIADVVARCGAPPKSIIKVVQFLSSLKNGELVDRAEVIKRSGVTAETLGSGEYAKALAEYRQRVPGPGGGGSYFGNKATIRKLREQLEMVKGDSA